MSALNTEVKTAALHQEDAHQPRLLRSQGMASGLNPAGVVLVSSSIEVCVAFGLFTCGLEFLPGISHPRNSTWKPATTERMTCSSSTACPRRSPLQVLPGRAQGPGKDPAAVPPPSSRPGVSARPSEWLASCDASPRLVFMLSPFCGTEK